MQHSSDDNQKPHPVTAVGARRRCIIQRPYDFRFNIYFFAREALSSVGSAFSRLSGVGLGLGPGFFVCPRMAMCPTKRIAKTRTSRQRNPLVIIRSNITRYYTEPFRISRSYCV